MDVIETKALALLREITVERGDETPLIFCRSTYPTSHEAICRAIEQHEAFRQEVSDAVEAAIGIAVKANYACERGPAILEILSRFIIKPPVDPLVEALADCRGCQLDEQQAKALRAAIEARGGKITFPGDDGHD